MKNYLNFETDIKNLEKYMIAYNMIFVSQQLENKKIKSDFTKEQVVSVIELKEQLLDLFFNLINANYSELKDSVKETEVYHDDNDENYEESLSILADARKEVFEFFDNVKVNEENETLRKNRLELINMLCKTFQNFTNFQLLKAINE